MNLLSIVIQRFVELCEIPDLYLALEKDLLTIDVNLNQQNRQRIEINFNSVATAKKIFSYYRDLILVIQMLNISEIKMTINGHFFRMLSMNSNDIENQMFLKQMDALQEMSNRLEIDLNSLYNSTNPSYIVLMSNDKVIFANPAALSAQQKTPDEFLGENMAGLNYPDEFERRNQMLRMDGKLTNYQYIGFQWYKDETIWRRKEVEVVTDLTVISLFGISCRVGIDLSIRETKRFAD